MEIVRIEEYKVDSVKSVKITSAPAVANRYDGKIDISVNGKADGEVMLKVYFANVSGGIVDGTVYVNGKSAGTVENMTSFHLHTSQAGYRNLVVGGDTYLTQKLTDPSKCTVAILNIYDNALTVAEVTAAYGAAIKK
jgi:hypothetical protein